MKVRVRVSKGKPTISLCIQETATLGSLREQLASGKLVTGDFVFSLNGRDSLDEDKTLHDLGIVSGDLLHLILVQEEEGTGKTPSEEKQLHIRPGSKVNPTASNQMCSCSHVNGQTEWVNKKPQCGQAANSSNHIQGCFSNRLNTSDNMESGQDFSMECGQGFSMESGQDLDLQTSAPNPVMECRQDSVAPTATGVANDTFSNRNHFEQFLREQLPADVSCGATVLSLALHALMLDSGFMEQEGGSTVLVGVVKRYYSTAVKEGIGVTMVTTTMGPVLAVQVLATLSEGKDEDITSRTISCSSQLDLDHYTSTTRERTVPSQMLRHTSQLARTFKDTVAHKLLTKIRIALGLPEVGTLISLFPELKLHIMKYLDVHSLVAMTMTCHELYILGQDSFLWRELFTRDFGQALLGGGEGLSWKDTYIQHYKWRQESRRQHQRWVTMTTTDPLSHLPSAVCPPGFVTFPGVIGGDYDRLPHALAPPPSSVPRPWFNPYSPLSEFRQPGSYPTLMDGRKGRRMPGDVHFSRHGRGTFGRMQFF